MITAIIVALIMLTTTIMAAMIPVIMVPPLDLGIVARFGLVDGDNNTQVLLGAK